MPTRGLPRTITSLLECFRGCFTAPTFEAFCALTVGFWAQILQVQGAWADAES